MTPELGGSQISALLESVPGIARVLRSPVADGIVNMIRAGARLEPFNRTDAEELIRFAIRRSLITETEGDKVLSEIKGIGYKRKAKTAARKFVPSAKKPNPFRKAVPKPVVKPVAPKPEKKVAEAATEKKATKKPVKPVKTVAKKAVKKAVKKTVKKTVKKAVKKTAKKATKKSTKDKKTTKRRR
jgi:hypothetical protein